MLDPKLFGIGNEPGWAGVFTREQAAAAIYKNGARIEKAEFEDGDAHPIGALGTVLGSIHAPKLGTAYFIEWDDEPKVAVAVTEKRIRPARSRGYWMFETTGVLRPAVEAFLFTQTPLSEPHVAALRAYCRQWIELFEPPDGAPEAERRVIERLRRMVDGLVDRTSIRIWIMNAADIGADPL
jgi:hypothetical protein